MADDRLIRLNAALDAFKKELTVGESKGNYVTICSAVTYEGAKQILEGLPSAQPMEDARAMCGECDAWNQYKNYPQPGWIPWDSGKLPVESGQYIVTAYDGNISRVTFAKYQKRLRRWELTGARAYWRVLAWIPLPEPYKDDEHETD